MILPAVYLRFPDRRKACKGELPAFHFADSRIDLFAIIQACFSIHKRFLHPQSSQSQCSWRPAHLGPVRQNWKRPPIFSASNLAKKLSSSAKQPKGANWTAHKLECSTKGQVVPLGVWQIQKSPLQNEVFFHGFYPCPAIKGASCKPQEAPATLWIV